MGVWVDVSYPAVWQQLWGHVVTRRSFFLLCVGAMCCVVCCNRLRQSSESAQECAAVECLLGLCRVLLCRRERSWTT